MIWEKYGEDLPLFFDYSIKIIFLSSNILQKSRAEPHSKKRTIGLIFAKRQGTPKKIKASVSGGHIHAKRAALPQARPLSRGADAGEKRSAGVQNHRHIRAHNFFKAGIFFPLFHQLGVGGRAELAANIGRFAQITEKRIVKRQKFRRGKQHHK